MDWKGRSKCSPQGASARSNFSSLFHTSHVLNRKPIAFPIEHIVLLIDCCVAISEVDSDLFIKPFVTKACPEQQHRRSHSQCAWFIIRTEQHRFASEAKKSAIHGEKLGLSEPNKLIPNEIVLQIQLRTNVIRLIQALLKYVYSWLCSADLERTSSVDHINSQWRRRCERRSVAPAAAEQQILNVKMYMTNKIIRRKRTESTKRTFGSALKSRLWHNCICVAVCSPVRWACCRALF